MKKKALLSISLLTAAITGVAPLTSYAAEVRVVQLQPGGEYQVISGEDDECLQKILKEIDSVISNLGDACTGAGTPGTDTPETGTPDASIPDVPETNAPDASVPDVPETVTPDVSAPDVPGTNTPDADVPEIPGTDTADTPETPDTGILDTPDTNKPEIPGTPDQETPDTSDTETPDGQEPDGAGTDEAELSYAKQILKLVNAERAKAGLPALELQSDITAAANVRAKEIKQSFSHTRPDGSSFSSVLKEQGVAYRGSGENIAYGQRTPEQVMEGWMNSDGHRANILNENFKNLGVGYYQDERGVNYWVQLFAY